MIIRNCHNCNEYKFLEEPPFCADCVYDVEIKSESLIVSSDKVVITDVSQFKDVFDDIESYNVVRSCEFTDGEINIQLYGSRMAVLIMNDNESYAQQCAEVLDLVYDNTEKLD